MLWVLAGLALGWLLAQWAGVPQRYVVADESMSPTLLPGDRLLVLAGGRGVRLGDVVVAADPMVPARRLVKRVAAIQPDGRVALAGDNAARSRDSRAFGAVAPGDVLGRVVWRYLPGARRGPVR